MSRLKSDNSFDINLIPDSIVNLRFDELKLNVDRKITCQMHKINAFINYGTWNKDMSDMFT